MSKYNYPGQGADNKARGIAQDLHAVYLKNLSSKLKPLEWAGPVGMRKIDIDVFVAAAVYFEHIIAVRHTNEKSLQYIREKWYAPKPIDCKIKTAEEDAYIAAARMKSKCGGLVVDPGIVGYAAFPTPAKLSSALKEWTKFINGRTMAEEASKIFPRHASRGFYAIDTDKTSQHYGCMMLSEQNIPSPSFRLDDPAARDFKHNHMKYLHGDYDLYGLIDIEKTEKKLIESKGRQKHSPVLNKALLHGMPHSFTDQFEDFKLFINTGIGADMIQHDAQDNIEHKGDTLYVFYPNRAKYVLNDASADAIREIYDVVFKQDVKT